MAEKQINIAIAYDFDWTLASCDMAETSLLPSLGLVAKEFWKEVNETTRQQEMDPILSYLYMLIKKSEEKGVSLTKESLKECGKNLPYFNGVEEYFSKINKYAESKGVKLDHYVISSGNKEIIEGSLIAKEFKKIYACSFKFDKNGIAEWPGITVNYTGKTQFLFRINKGIENAWDNSEINKYVERDKRPMPFENMIYLGDGETDVPAMTLLKQEGGHSIAVYAPERPKPNDLLTDGRVNYVTEADYSEDSELFSIIKDIIKKAC